MSIIQAVIGSIASSGAARTTYTLTAAANNVDEGGSLTFTVNTTNVVDGTTLWWTTSNNFDGSSRMDNPTGSLNIYSNTGSFSITVSADSTTAQSQQTYSVFLYYGGPGGYGGTYTGASVDNIAVNDTSQTPAPVPPFSLEFVESQGDYLEAAGSSDWNLGDTWTIEFYLNADAASATAQGGIWGLLNQVGWSTTNAIVVALSDNKLVYLSRAWNANDDVRYVEPTPGVWTHVAIANDAGTQKVFYNGVEQTRVSGNAGSASYTNGSSPLRIGRLGPANGGTLNGKMALVRISNTAKYSTAFIPTTTYGSVGAGSSLVIETGGAYGDTAVSIASDPTLATTYPAGSTITFQDGEVRTITGYDNYPGGTDIFWNTSKTGTLFPITLKTANYAEGDTVLFLGTDTPLVDSRSHTITNNGVALSNNVPHTLTVLAYDFNHGYATNYGSNQIWVLIADYPDIVNVPNGATIVVSGQNSGTYTAGGVMTIMGKRMLASGFSGSVNGSDTLTITWTA